MTRFDVVTAGLKALERGRLPQPLSPGALVRSWLAPSLFREVPHDASVQDYVDWVKQEEALPTPRARLVRNDSPQAGDVFCLYYQSLQRYAHMGLVLYAEVGAFRTIEGAQGSDGVLTKRRSLGPSVLFIRYDDEP